MVLEAGLPTIYSIRHGETDWNAAGRFQGWKDIPLNPRGEAQAAHVGDVLAKVLARDGKHPADLAFVASPLGRARATMDRVRLGLRLPVDGYTLDDRLREVGYGLWEGTTLAEQEAMHPAVFARRQIDKWSVSPPDGESYETLTMRVRAWVDGLTGDTVAVAHGGTARALMVIFGVCPPLEAADTAIAQGAVYAFGAGGLSILR